MIAALREKQPRRIVLPARVLQARACDGIMRLHMPVANFTGEIHLHSVTRPGRKRRPQSAHPLAYLGEVFRCGGMADRVDEKSRIIVHERAGIGR
ncbi:hypothetical protein [Rhodanobacter sp. MP7CTX1]|uniref:hypothetical protein n=1 Tax=Rhodanobacter sp. MP7CTX1 TaxID=2723084 RepID=UPI001610AB2E|nr:hypothetical protein [Rhodanobacter sp. MP7CTX1]MBB6189333.1 hypothetical protein [Rhodanobacter sp. MP7CTX1]